MRDPQPNLLRQRVKINRGTDWHEHYPLGAFVYQSVVTSAKAKLERVDVPGNWAPCNSHCTGVLSRTDAVQDSHGCRQGNKGCRRIRVAWSSASSSTKASPERRGDEEAVCDPCFGSLLEWIRVSELRDGDAGVLGVERTRREEQRGRLRKSRVDREVHNR
ncbi:hypothetical protein DPEC_G00202780 [Dallia pectoralis]|uniref:Uncharacterized protein n=1 Tax=Dallia pectoralis TaxID=75939 RepID=A0ACC2G9L7_DALPE|nr:hypothetical protein DPEC_G00202780 [Dallia pectoralis]